MPTYRKKAPLVTGHYYINPNAGPLWFCTATALIAETRIVPGSKLKVMLTEEMPHFFNSLVEATEGEAQQRRVVQEEQAKQYARMMSRGRYAYAQT